MKKTSLVITTLILFCGNLFSQLENFPRNNETKSIEFTEVFSTNKSKEEFLLNAIEVLKRCYNGDQDVVNNNLPVNVSATKFGNIQVKSKAIITSCAAIQYAFKYNVMIECKENKWRYVIRDIYLIEEGGVTSKQGILGDVTSKKIASKEKPLEEYIAAVKKCEDKWSEFFNEIEAIIRKDIKYITTELNKKDDW